MSGEGAALASAPPALDRPHSVRIGQHIVEIDPRGLVIVDGITYSVGVLAGDLITPPEQWCQIRREGGTLVVRTAREAAIREGKA